MGQIKTKTLLILLIFITGSFYLIRGQESRRPGSGLYMQVCGTVIDRDTGRGLSGVEIGISNQLDGTDIFGTSGKNGNFCIKMVPEGIYRFPIMPIYKSCSPNYLVDSIPDKITVSPGKNIMRLKIYLRKGGSVSGSILGPDGTTPVAGAHISRGKWQRGQDEYVYSSNNGSFTLPGLESGHQIVFVEMNGFAVLKKEYDIVAGKSLLNERIILGAGKVSVKGRLLDSQNNSPLKNATVFFKFRETGQNFSAGYDETDGAGNFSLAGLKEPGKYEVNAICEGFKFEKKVVELESGENDIYLSMDAKVENMAKKVPAAGTQADAPTQKKRARTAQSKTDCSEPGPDNVNKNCKCLSFNSGEQKLNNSQDMTCMTLDEQPECVGSAGTLERRNGKKKTGEENGDRQLFSYKRPKPALHVHPLPT
ncbi:MAG: hypothetical protein GY757_21500 [bacterium]|nr:hypothetical protein [bacterium]